MRARLPGLLLAVALLAGCAQPAPAPADAPPLPPAPFADAFAGQAGHDHQDPAAHAFSWGLDVAALVPRADLLGDEPGRLSDLQFHGTLATVTVNGGSGGFLLLDAADPLALRVLGRYRSGSEDNWYTKLTPEGGHVLLTANGGLQPAGIAAGLLEGARRGAASGAARGLHVVDVTDPAAPRLAGVFPASIRLINAAVAEVGGQTHVFASVAEDRLAQTPHPGIGLANHVALLRLVEVPGGSVRLEEVARWMPGAAASDEVFPHDLAVETHPLTGQTLLYVANWMAGAWIVDVSDPARPATLAKVETDLALPAHTFKPHPGLVDGRHLSLVGPETFAGEPGGAYVLVDTTDPARPAVLDSWTLPGDLVNEENLLWSPHEFTLAEGKAYLSQFHAGAGVLSLRGGALAPLAWRAAAFPGVGADARWASDVETFVRHGDYAYAVDMGGGILVLRETSG
jgi:hypothetical protein